MFLRILNIVFSATAGGFWAQGILAAVRHDYAVAIVMLAISGAAAFFAILVLLYRIATDQ